MSLKLADVLSLSCYVRFFNVPHIFMTWGRRLYFLSEERRAADFYRPWKYIASARFEPANLRFTGKDDNHYTTMRYVFIKIFTENFRLIFLLILKGYWAIIYPNVSFGTDIRGFLQFNTACVILLYIIIYISRWILYFDVITGKAADMNTWEYSIFIVTMIN
jgi:hypothetical protein